MLNFNQNYLNVRILSETFEPPSECTGRKFISLETMPSFTLSVITLTTELLKLTLLNYSIT